MSQTNPTEQLVEDVAALYFGAIGAFGVDVRVETHGGPIAFPG